MRYITTISLFFGALLFGFVGCAGMHSESLPPELKAYARESLQLSLFVAQRFLTGPEFERYTLRDERLSWECGSVVLGPEQQTLVVREKDSVQLKGREVAEIKRNTKRLEQALSAGRTGLPAPGTLAALGDKGVTDLRFVLSGKSELVATALQPLAAPGSDVLKRLRVLFLSLRGAGSAEKCGHRTFYGIGAEANYESL